MTDKLKKAVDIAKKYHEWQLRKCWADYVNHPLKNL